MSALVISVLLHNNLQSIGRPDKIKPISGAMSACR